MLPLRPVPDHDLGRAPQRRAAAARSERVAEPMGCVRRALGYVGSEPRVRPSSGAGRWRRRQRGRASADPRVRSAAIVWKREPARPAATTAAALAEADTRRVRAAAHRQAELRMQAEHTAPVAVAHKARPVAAHRARALGRSPPVADHRPRAELLAAALRSPLVDRRTLAKQWRQTGSCLPASRSERDQPEARGRSHQDLLAERPKRVREVARSPAPAARAVAANCPAPVARRRAAEPLPVAALPRRERAEVAAAAAARVEHHDQARELLRRLTGCRRTSKICWWAGSRRRTACTRSCENSRARAVPRSLARPSVGSIPVLLHHYAVKGGPTRGATPAPRNPRWLVTEAKKPTSRTGLNSPFSPGVGNARDGSKRLATRAFARTVSRFQRSFSS